MPEDMRHKVGIIFVRVLLELMCDEPGRLSSVALAIGDLVRGNRVKLGTLREAITSWHYDLGAHLERMPRAWEVMSRVLVHLFPQRIEAGWGWSRVGWGWAEWWKLMEALLHDMPPSKAFDVLAMALKLMQDEDGGTPISDQAIWSLSGGESAAFLQERAQDQQRLQRLWGKLNELSGGLGELKLRKKLRTFGIDLWDQEDSKSDSGSTTSNTSGGGSTMSTDD